MSVAGIVVRAVFTREHAPTFPTQLMDCEEELICRMTANGNNPLVAAQADAGVTPVSGRALIVEDEIRLASLLAQHLSELGFTVTTVHDGASALERAVADAYDLVILDVMLPGLDGFAVCRELRRQHVVAPILMLSARGVTEDRVRGLDSGADDYLTKPFEFAELGARVRALLRRGGSASTLMLNVAGVHLDPLTRVVQRGNRKLDLTQKEFALLEYLMRNADHVMTRAMIGEHVWNFTWDRMTNVIDVYVNHLRHKLEDNGEPRVIDAVRGVGYILRSSGVDDDRDA